MNELGPTTRYMKAEEALEKALAENQKLAAAMTAERRLREGYEKALREIESWCADSDHTAERTREGAEAMALLAYDALLWGNSTQPNPGEKRVRLPLKGSVS